MRLLILVSLWALSATPALALDTSTRAGSPALVWTEQKLARFDASWIHVKFTEGFAVEETQGRFLRDGVPLDAVNGVLGNALAIRRTFPGARETFREWKRRGELASGRTGPDLSLWYDVRLPEDRASLAEAINSLNALADVEIAHPAPICETAVIWGNATNGADGADGTNGADDSDGTNDSNDSDGVAPEPDDVTAPTAPVTARAARAAEPAGSGFRGTTPDFSAQQGYLYDTPVGLDAPSAWSLPGGRGDGVRFIDVELGWIHGHEDFNALTQFYSGGVSDPEYVDHGTSVLGEVIGRDNGIGVTGFASEATWGTVAVTVGEWPDVPHYFQEAVDQLEAGDVWLIELQMYPPGRSATPMEWLQVNYDVIWTSCWALDIVCVEAGANGSQNLDEASWDGVFDRDVRDSGAILVGAGTPNGRVAEWFTNYGSRIDVHAWGSAIVTTGYGDLYNGGSMESWYTSAFGGTSGASPMITGSSLCIQGVAKAALGSPLTPPALRQLLVETGIPHLDPSREIGPRPDLAAAVDGLIDPASVPVVPSAVASADLRALSPFTRDTEIRFSQAVSGPVRVDLHDVGGRLIRSLALAPAGSGERNVRWDGQDDHGAEVRSGVYWVRVTTPTDVLTGRLVKVR